MINVDIFNDRENPLPLGLSTSALENTPEMHKIGTNVTKQMWKLFKETYSLLKDYRNYKDAIANGLSFYLSDGNVQNEGENSIAIVWYWAGKGHRDHLNAMSMISVRVNCTSKTHLDWNIVHVSNVIPCSLKKSLLLRATILIYYDRTPYRFLLTQYVSWAGVC